MGGSHDEGENHSIPSTIYEQEDSSHFPEAFVFEEQSKEEEGQVA